MPIRYREAAAHQSQGRASRARKMKIQLPALPREEPPKRKLNATRNDARQQAQAELARLRNELGERGNSK